MADGCDRGRRPPLPLGPLHRRLVYATLALLWGSGVLWLVFHYWVRQTGRFGPQHHPLEAWWLSLHGLAVTGVLILLGSVFVQHARSGWALRRNRAGGAALLAVLGWLTLTGYALYYFPDILDNHLASLHWLPGLALPALTAWHVRRGWRATRGKTRRLRNRNPAYPVMMGGEARTARSCEDGSR